MDQAWTVDSDSRGQLSTLERERWIARLAKRQHGVVGRRQLVALGLSRDAIDRACARGACTRSTAACTPSATVA